MSGTSNIEWTDATWNPTRGCSMMVGSNSPECGGCYNCYAARQALRHTGKGRPYEGLVKLTAHGPRWTGKVVEGDLEAPLHWRAPRRVFVDSMSDLFHESLSFEFIRSVYTVMIAAPQHTYQVLTKRAARRREFYDWWKENGEGPGGKVRSEPWPQIWEGVSCENQPAYLARWEHLRRTPAAVRFLSLEPMLAPIDISPSLRPPAPAYPGFRQEADLAGPYPDWVIIGGESGPGARPFDLAWALDVIEQCKAAGVPVFMKQLGARPVNPSIGGLRDSKGGDPAEWPEWARVREWPR